MTPKTLRLIGAITLLSFNALAEGSTFQSSVIGSNPGLAIGGVNSGGAPWVVKEGHASISPGGRIHVEVQGLLLAAGAAAGTTGPVRMVAATLVCGGSGGSPVAVADTAISPSPLSSSGGAQIEQSISLPSACFGPVVLVRVFNASAALGSQLGPFIAVAGLTPGQGRNQN